MAKKKPTVPSSVKREVKIKVTGGMRRAGILVEATSIGLKRHGSTWTGKKDVDIECPIDVRPLVKGQKNRGISYDFAVTINKKTKNVKGTIGSSDLKEDKATWKCSDFNIKLPKKSKKKAGKSKK